MPRTDDLRVHVCGLGHLGTVTAAGVAEHFTTVATTDPALISQLRSGLPPVSEPGLTELLKAGAAAGRLSFSDSPSALKDADLVWFTFETPVDENDAADIDFVENHMLALLAHLPEKALVLISSQVPVGFTARCEAAFRKERPQAAGSFAYSPENLQLGRALEAFRQPQRIVAGVRDQAAQARLTPFLKPFSERLEWMSVESAEMTKHALNSFLATSVAFINELSELCERVGADPKEVERGLKSEARIGPKAYLRPGAAFSGGTLARDVNFLVAIGERSSHPSVLSPPCSPATTPTRAGPRERCWSCWAIFPERRSRFGACRTSRARIRSGAQEPSSVPLADPAAGARPGVRPRRQGTPRRLEGEGAALRERRRSPEPGGRADRGDRMAGIQKIPAEAVAGMRTKVIVDAGGFLGETLGRAPHVRYAAVGAA